MLKRQDKFDKEHKNVHDGLAHPLSIGEKPQFHIEEVEAFLRSMGYSDPFEKNLSVRKIYEENCGI